MGKWNLYEMEPSRGKKSVCHIHSLLIISKPSVSIQSLFNKYTKAL